MSNPEIYSSLLATADFSTDAAETSANVVKAFDCTLPTFDSFCEIAPTTCQIQVEASANAKHQEAIQLHVQANGYVKLKSDYRGMDSYYYDPYSRTVYKICNVARMWGSSGVLCFETVHDPHILELNGLM